MKLILASDFQAQVSNLDLCQVAVDEILADAKVFKPDAIILAGDLKEAYDPVSLFVIKFWHNTIQRVVEKGYRLIILKGNHDRLSQSRRSKDWLSVLRTAGAEVVTKPVWKECGDGRLAFLPFTPDAAKELKWAQSLASEGRGRGDVLIFHTGVAGARMGAIAGTGITPEDLLGCRVSPLGKDSAYEAAFGGHFHEYQKIKGYPIWYIGSPFCQGWGEVNQVKGHLRVEL